MTPAIKAALSGALTGGVFGGGGAALTGEKELAKLLKAALIGGGLGGTAAGSATAVGEDVMGEPTQEEGGAPYARRGGIGGMLLGGGIGAALGAAGASGKLGKLAEHAPQFLKTAGMAAKNEMPKGLVDNILIKKIAELGKNPSLKGVALGAGLGAATLGAPMGYYAAGEGSGIDTMNRELEDEKKRRLIQAMKDYYGEEG